MYQDLILVEKDAGGEVSTRNILGVAFVPLQEESPADNGG
jgi:protein-L-isoaspartate O-methyltransferase